MGRVKISATYKRRMSNKCYNVPLLKHPSPEYEIFDVVTLTLSLSQYRVSRSVAAVVSGFCFIIVAAVIVLGLGELFLLFVLSVYSYTIASHSWETYESCYMILSFRPKHNQLLHFRTQDLTHETVSR